MALKKDVGAFRAHMTAMPSNLKALIGNIGYGAGPKAPGSSANSYSQVNPKSVRGKKR